MYGLPKYIVEKIIDDYCNQESGQLSSIDYENIMIQLSNVDKSILKRRLIVFNQFDDDKDGYIELKQLPELHNYMNNELKRTNNARNLYSEDFVLNHFNKNTHGEFSFLDINKYMQHLHLNFV